MERTLALDLKRLRFGHGELTVTKAEADPPGSGLEVGMTRLAHV